MPVTLLEDRGVLRLAGERAAAFLQGLVTNDVEGLEPGAARYAALLSPQGKILFDFFVVRRRLAEAGELFLEGPRDRLRDLLQKLIVYRLRAPVDLEDVSERYAVAAAWPEAEEAALGDDRFQDPRRAGAGARAFVARGSGLPRDDDAYEAHRIALGLPKGGADFLYGDAFPHEADMDRLNGLSFDKGCYVGQEVVSRMRHRGTARNRVVRVGFAGPAPSPATEIRSGEILLGRMGSSAGGQGLAMLRTDRLEEAIAAARPILAAGVALRLLAPSE